MQTERSPALGQVRVIEPETRVATRVRDLLGYRELLANLIRKELRIKYKNSALGFVWSMLNPALYLVIFYIVFTLFLGARIPYFHIYILCGLMPWNLFSASLGGGVSSLVGNSSLITKVYFPREILPLASIGASLMHFFFQFIVLLLALVVFRYPVGPEALVLVPTALVVELLFLVGISMIVAVLNVYFRDVQHLLELVLLAWFWMTPIVYQVTLIAEKGPDIFKVFMLNPMLHVILAFQRGIYGDRAGVLLPDTPLWWYLRNLGIVAIASILLIWIGWAIFRRLESRLAEEL